MELFYARGQSSPHRDLCVPIFLMLQFDDVQFKASSFVFSGKFKLETYSKASPPCFDANTALDPSWCFICIIFAFKTSAFAYSFLNKKQNSENV